METYRGYQETLAWTNPETGWYQDAELSDWLRFGQEFADFSSSEEELINAASKRAQVFLDSTHRGIRKTPLLSP